MPTRRILLIRGAVAVTSALAISAANSRAEADMPLMSKTTAAYQDQPHAGQSCSACCMFVPGDPSHCTMISGTISAHGWCKFWQAGPNDTCS